MSGKKGASGRLNEKGYTTRLNLRVDPEVVSCELVELLKTIEDEQNTKKRGELLDKALQERIDIREYFIESLLNSSGNDYIDKLHWILANGIPPRDCYDIEKFVRKWVLKTLNHDLSDIVISEDKVEFLLPLNANTWVISIQIIQGDGSLLFDAIIAPEQITEQENTKSGKYGKPRSITKKMRFMVLKKCNYKCVICGRGAIDGAMLVIDHIHPVSRGGTRDMSNLQALCFDCNMGKGADDM